MSLYDGVGLDEALPSKGKENSLDSSKIADWSSGLQFMKTQLQLKKASKAPLGKSRPGITNSGPGSMTLAHLTGRETKTILVDEYDPLRPNDYDNWKGKMKAKAEEERRQKDRERDRQRDREREERRSRHSENDSHEKSKSRDSDRDRDRERRRSDDRDRSHDRERRRDRRDDDTDDRDSRRRDRDDRDKDRRRSHHTDNEDRNNDKPSAMNSARGAAIAPPPSLVEAVAPSEKEKKGAGTGGFATSNQFATQIMARYGWKEGQGLGKDEQGLSTCLQVEKTSRRGGKIINKDRQAPVPEVPGFVEPEPVPMPPPSVPPSTNAVMKNPSKVALLKNMVGPGEVDDDLQPEVEEECHKYGEVTKVMIYEIPGKPEDEAVRIFVEFKRIESATKAIVDLNGRYFGGRLVKASFYNLDRFRRFDLQHD